MMEEEEGISLLKVDDDNNVFVRYVDYYTGKHDRIEK